MVVAAFPFGVGVGGSGSWSGVRSSRARTMSRCEAEYFGLQVVSVRVARSWPGRAGSGDGSSTLISPGSTTRWSVTWYLNFPWTVATTIWSPGCSWSRSPNGAP